MEVSEIPEIEELDKLFKPLKKKAFIPTTEKCEPEYEGSRFDGFPWLKDKQKWPQSNSSNMNLTLQLEISDIPDTLNPLSNIENGYIQLFRDEGTYAEYGKDSKIFILDRDKDGGKIFDPSKKKQKAVFTEEDSQRLKQLNAEKKQRTPEAMKLLQKLQKSYKSQQVVKSEAIKITGWTEVDDYPHPVDISEGDIEFPFDLYEFIEDIAEKYDLYIDDIEEYLDKTYKCHAGDKIGGYPYWTQGVETPSYKKEKMVYLLQLDGEGDSSFKMDGTGHLFYLPSNPEVMKFIWACT